MITKAIALSVGLLLSTFAVSAYSRTDTTAPAAPAASSTPDATCKLVVPSSPGADIFDVTTSLTCPKGWHVCQCSFGPMCARTGLPCSHWCDS